MADAARYDAFITYSHADARVAGRIQAFLERYRLPGGRRLRIYLDRTDIRSGALTGEIQNALDASAALVVCGSASAAASEWVARETDAFLAGAQRPVAVALVADEPGIAMPASIRERELRYSDLRRAWRLGVLRPSARTELVRLIATIAGVELRALIPWDRRRRVRRAALTAAGVTLVASAGLSVPVPAWRELPLPPSVATSGYSIDAAEAHGGQLTVLTRMPATSSRGYVEIWRGVPGAEGTGEWLDRNYSPRSRLLPIAFADPAVVERALRALGIPGDGSLWIGEPLPDHFIALRSTIPDDYTPLAGEALIGSSDVWVVSRNQPARHSVVEELYAEAVVPPAGERLFDVSTGIAVAWGSTGIWIGTRISPSFSSSGGLFRSADSGASFRSIAGFRNVHSVIADEPDRGVVLVAEHARTPPPNTQVPVSPPRRSRIAIGPAEGEWPDFAGPPHGDADVLEIVGRAEGGGVIVRVGQTLYTQSRTALVNRLRSRR